MRERELVGGSTVLLFGILSLAFCGIFGPLAWLRGNAALRQLDDGMGNESERGLVVAGRICGIIGTILLVFFMVALTMRVASETH